MNISFSGHRDFDRHNFEQTLLERLLIYARLGGTTTFWCGMAVGFDLATGEAVLALKDRGYDVELNCVVPYPEQALFFSTEDMERYERILRRADFVITLAGEYSRDVYHRRNDFLVEQADILFVYFNGERSSGTGYTVRRARTKKIAVENIYPQPQLSLF